MVITSIKNLTTNREILKSSQIDFIKILEYGKSSLVFVFPADLQKGHSSLLISGIMTIRGKKNGFEFTGKIETSERMDNATRIQLNLVQYDRDLWRKFLRQAVSRQNKVDKLLRALKGEV